jgi:hypothetical protein
MIEIEGGNHLRMLKLLYQLLQMFRKRDLHYRIFCVSCPVTCIKRAKPAGCGGVVNPNQHEHVMQELLREQGDQSKLMNNTKNQINDGLSRFIIFKP